MTSRPHRSTRPLTLTLSVTLLALLWGCGDEADDPATAEAKSATTTVDGAAEAAEVSGWFADTTGLDTPIPPTETEARPVAIDNATVIVLVTDIKTGMTAADQEVAYRALRRGLLNYEQRQWYRGPEAYVNLPGAPEALDDKLVTAAAFIAQAMVYSSSAGLWSTIRSPWASALILSKLPMLSLLSSFANSVFTPFRSMPATVCPPKGISSQMISFVANSKTPKTSPLARLWEIRT